MTEASETSEATGSLGPQVAMVADFGGLLTRHGRPSDPEQSEQGEVHLDAPVNVLASFAYYRDEDMAKLRSWGLRVIGDSGAFSAASLGRRIELEEFAEWVTRWRGDLFWAASLDVIGDPEASWRNWLALSEAGVEVVPTVHYGAPPSTLDRYADRGVDFVGLGGLVSYSGEVARQMRWCVAMMRHARDNFPAMRFHGWGVTTRAVVQSLPWWSVDSSTFADAFRFGHTALFDPDSGRQVRFRLDGREPARHARLLRKHYGVDWREVLTSSAANRRTVVRMSMRSVQLLEGYLRARHRVSPPPSLVDRLGVGAVGPQGFMALGTPSMQPQCSLDPDDPQRKGGTLVHAVLTTRSDLESARP